MANAISNRQEVSLPPPDSDPIRLLALSGTATSLSTETTLEQLLAEIGPDAIVATPPQPNIVEAALPREHDRPVLSPSAGMRPRSVKLSEGDWCLVTVPDTTADTDPSTHIDETDQDDSLQRVCLTPRLNLDVNLYEKAVTIDGIASYRELLPDSWASDGTVHCSTNLRSGYQTTVETEDGHIPVVGIGTGEATLGVGISHEGGRRDATVLDIYPGGIVSTETVSPDAFGVTGIPGVGDNKAKTLGNADYQTVAAVADAPIRELQELPGFGPTNSQKIKRAAAAQSEETVVATGDDSLPSGDPIFIDIETDGLEPSVVWLIGVLDGGADDGRYMPFIEQEPNTTDHIEAFVSWMDANAANRPIVAWNGYRFDFPALTDQIRQHCPEYEQTWDNAYQFDALWWARDKDGDGNAALPGYNNKLETVATALGWEPMTTGLDGKTVAAVYMSYRQAWLAADDPSAVTEPDWDRLKTYCEDDVRALATIYDALESAARREPGTTNGTTESTQGALSDFT